MNKDRNIVSGQEKWSLLSLLRGVSFHDDEELWHWIVQSSNGKFDIYGFQIIHLLYN